MSDDNSQARWLEEHKELWLEQRKFMWSDEMVEKIAGWANIRPGITVLDVGCGAGFLGRTYWQYFKDGGHYIGVDISTELCSDAKKAAYDWSNEKATCFIAGDAHILPFKDNSVDMVMSQILFVHIKDPKRALSEMARIIKPGGYIICKEQDHYAVGQMGSYNSALAAWIELQFDCNQELIIMNQIKSLLRVQCCAVKNPPVTNKSIITPNYISLPIIYDYFYIKCKKRGN
jgi:ubiquinone/menaquinone biosynthesis C-methylase UbiE